MTDLIELVGKKEVRTILAALERRPRSVRQLSDDCDVPLTSTYRYLEQLLEVDLVERRTELHPDGHHYDVYHTDFRALLMYLEDGDVKRDVCACSEEEADRLIWVWKRLRNCD